MSYKFVEDCEKNPEFNNSILTGKDETFSSFVDSLKTMNVCKTILAQALIGSLGCNGFA